MTQISFQGTGGFAYGDSQTYYFSPFSTTNPSTSGNSVSQRWYLPDTEFDTGTFLLYVNGTLGSSETATFGIEINGSKTPIETGVVADSAENFYAFDNLGITINEGDYVHFYLETPAWATNPTTVYTRASLESAGGGGTTVDVEFPEVFETSNTTLNIFFGFLIFLAMFYGMLWMFKKK
jgi:hypothetical protein